MPAIRWDTFAGIIPRLDPKLLPNQAAQTAQNVKLISGKLEPIIETSVIEGIDPGQKTIYLWHRNNTTAWLKWADIVHVVETPIAEDRYERIYYVGDSTAASGTTPYALKVRAYDPDIASVVLRDAKMPIPIKPSVAPAWIFNPLSGATAVSCKAQNVSTIFGVTRQDAGTLADPYLVGSLINYEMTNDGRMRISFRFPAKRYTVIQSLAGPPPVHWATYNKTSVVNFQLTLGTLGSVPTAMGDPLQSKTIALLDDGGTQYGTFEVASVSISGRNVAWHDIEIEPDPVFFIPTRNQATPDITGFVAEFTIKMNYTRQTTQYQYYVQRAVEDWGTEGPPSAISGIVEWAPGKKIVLTAPNTDADGAALPARITKRRIYRSAAGTEEDEWYYLDEVAAATTSYTDIKTDSQLGEIMPRAENPPEDEDGDPIHLDGLISTPGGFLIAWKNKDVYMTEPNEPSNWPTKYRHTLDYPIVGGASNSAGCYLMTEGQPYVGIGDHPDLFRFDKIMHPQACISARGIAQVGEGVYYPSPDGYNVLIGGQGRLVTGQLMTKEDWEGFNPDSDTIAAVYDERLHVWTTSHGLIFDFKEAMAAMTTTDQTAAGLFNDLLSDGLYLIRGSSIRLWEGGTDPFIMTWTTKEFFLDRPWAWSHGRVIAASYPAAPNAITLALYADDALVDTRTVTSAAAFRIPKLTPRRRWRFRLVSTVKIDQIAVATNMGAMR